MERGARAIGISFNAAKCATLHLGGLEDENAPRPVLSLQGTPVSALAPGEAYSHLGIPTGYQVRQTPVTTLRELVADVKKLDNSHLARWQKLAAVGTFLLTREGLPDRSKSNHKAFSEELNGSSAAGQC